jgi:hypothetical protein
MTKAHEQHLNKYGITKEEYPLAKFKKEQWTNGTKDTLSITDKQYQEAVAAGYSGSKTSWVENQKERGRLESVKDAMKYSMKIESGAEEFDLDKAIDSEVVREASK